MTDKNLFETYFLVEDREVSIFVKRTHDSKIVFSIKKIDEDTKNLNIQELQLFFITQIEKIEKKFQLFIEDIFLIIEEDSVFSVRFSLKEKIENKVISKIEFKNILLSCLQQIYKFNPNQLIIHYLIDKLNVDGHKIESLDNKIIHNFLCIDLRFICIDKERVNKFRSLFKTKQIHLKKVFSGKYLKEFMINDEKIIDLATKINDGFNKFEVELVPKKAEKKGFFERFFLSF